MERKTDSELPHAVLQELKWDTRVEETDVGVEIDGGIVTLTGTVSSWAKKLAAEEAAHSAMGRSSASRAPGRRPPCRPSTMFSMD